MIDTDSLIWKVFANRAQATTRHVPEMFFISVCGRDNWLECARCGHILMRNVATIQEAADRVAVSGHCSKQYPS